MNLTDENEGNLLEILKKCWKTWKIFRKINADIFLENLYDGKSLRKTQKELKENFPGNSIKISD